MSPKEQLLSHPLLKGPYGQRNWTRNDIVGRFWTYQLRVAKWITHMEVSTDLDSTEELTGWLNVVRSSLAKVGLVEGWDPWVPEFHYFGAWIVVPIRPTLDLNSIFDVVGELVDSAMTTDPNDGLIEELRQPALLRVRNLLSGHSIIRSANVPA